MMQRQPLKTSPTGSDDQGMGTLISSLSPSGMCGILPDTNLSGPTPLCDLTISKAVPVIESDDPELLSVPVIGIRYWPRASVAGMMSSPQREGAWQQRRRHYQPIAFAPTTGRLPLCAGTPTS